MRTPVLQFSPVCSLFVVAVMAVGDSATGEQTAEVAFRQSATAVDVYDFVEVTINVARPTAANPFTDAVVTGECRCEDGEPVKVDGFCDSQDGSVFRIPDGATSRDAAGSI
jgi:hypothetical protein